ncbi:MAG: gamma-glutamyl-phosphate reductase, partial [Chloroflexi bacterium]|nr:gamma-glutamyl-phosphate reductase [Chloroflexota bacterium]
MQDAIKNLEEQGKLAKSAAHKLAHISSELKNKALINIANGLLERESEIIKANKMDYDKAKTEGIGDALLDRLLLNSSRIRGISDDVRTVAALADPVGEIFDMRTLPNGILLGKKRVPIGVIASIYESRPNVT